jgi:hypothetical protein
MTGDTAAGDLDLEQYGVLIAVNAQLADRQAVAAGLAFFPESPPRTTPEPRFRRRNRACQRLVVHVSDHQHFVGAFVRGDGGYQATGIEPRG